MTVPARPTPGAPIDSAWGGVAHDAAVAQDVQSGVAVAPATGSGVDASSVIVTFPRPFAAPPVVLATSQVAGFVAAATAISPTGFTLVNTNRETAGSLGARATSWVAIGPRA